MRRTLTVLLAAAALLPVPASARHVEAVVVGDCDGVAVDPEGSGTYTGVVVAVATVQPPLPMTVTVTCTFYEDDFGRTNVVLDEVSLTTPGSTGLLAGTYRVTAPFATYWACSSVSWRYLIDGHADGSQEGTCVLYTPL